MATKYAAVKARHDQLLKLRSKTHHDQEHKQLIKETAQAFLEAATDLFPTLTKNAAPNAVYDLIAYNAERYATRKRSSRASQTRRQP